MVVEVVVVLKGRPCKRLGNAGGALDVGNLDVPDGVLNLLCGGVQGYHAMRLQVGQTEGYNVFVR
jgi:hypothetical protein